MDKLSKVSCLSPMEFLKRFGYVAEPSIRKFPSTLEILSLKDFGRVLSVASAESKAETKSAGGAGAAAGSAGAAGAGAGAKGSGSPLPAAAAAGGAGLQPAGLAAPKSL